MKKLITSILATLACVGCLTSCSLLPGGKDSSTSSDETSSSSTVERGVDVARNFLLASYREDTANKETNKDYVVDHEFTYQDVTYTIEWSVDVTEGVKVDVATDGTVTINVDEGSDVEIPYVLTATITDPDGNTAEFSVNRKVLKAATIPGPISADPEVGVAYKFYVNQEANNSERFINGQMENDYYFATVDTFEAGIDVYVEAVPEKEGSFYLYYMNGETKTYINIVKSGNYTNAKYETTASSEYVYDADYGTMITKIDSTKYYLGCDGTYNTVEPQSSKDAGYYKGYLVTALNRKTTPDADKLAYDYGYLSLKTVYFGDASVKLPTTGRFTDVAIDWAVSENTVATINEADGKLVITAPEALTKVTLTATLSIGEDLTTTKDFTLKLYPVLDTAEKIVDNAYLLEKGESLDGTYELQGVVSEITVPYSTQYKNITFILTVLGKGDKPITCYRVKGQNADTLKVGDVVTMSGTIINYNGTIEYDNSATFVRSAYENATNEMKLEVESYFINFDEVYSENTTVALNVAGLQFTDVDIAWASDKACAVVEDGTLTITQQAEAQTVTLTATFSIDGTEIGTKTFTFDVAAIPATSPITISAAPAVDTAYVLYLRQAALGKTLYFSGEAVSGRFATTEVAANAATVYVEAVSGSEGSYYMYILNGNDKLYINYGSSSTSASLDATASTVYTYSAEYKTMLLSDGSKFLGTYNSYDTISTSNYSYITSNTNYITHLATLVENDDITGDMIAKEEAVDMRNPVTEEVISDSTFTLPVVGSVFENVTIAWTSNNTCAEISGSTLTVSVQATAQTVTLTGIVSVNGTAYPSNPIEFTFDVAAVAAPLTATSADFGTLTKNTSYGSHRSTDGWVATNAAVFAGGDTLASSSGIFPVLGDTNARAVCLNGKTSGVGSLVSPTIGNGIQSLSFNWSIMYNDTKISVTINIKDTNGNTVATTKLENLSLSTSEAPAGDKYKQQEFTWTLDSAVTGNFVIEIVNNCPSNTSSSNKDRIAIWNLAWVNASAE